MILAAALLQTGHADAARALLANRLDVVERFGFPDNVLMAYLHAGARNALRREDIRGAHAGAGPSSMRLGVRRKLPRLRVHALAERIRIHAFDRCSETVGHLLAALDELIASFDEGDLLPWRSHVRLMASIAHTHAAIARGTLDEADRALDDAASLAKSLSRGRDARTVMALRAVVAYERSGERAQPLLREALHLARIAGDAGFLAQVHPIAADMAAGFEDSAPRTRRVAVRRGSVRARRATANALLTPKEVEVLQLMEQGLSNKRIAQTLDVGGETVKWHLKNLFSKLSAVSRDHAIDRARLLGLVG